MEISARACAIGIFEQGFHELDVPLVFTQPHFSRRAMLVNGAVTLLYAMSGKAQATAAATVAELGRRAYPARIQSLVASDCGRARWRRTADRHDLAANLCFRSLDRFTPAGAYDARSGGWWLIDEPILSSVHAGGRVGTTQDSSRAIQAILDAAAKLGRPVDDSGAEFRVDSSIFLPPGVVWSGAKLRAGTPGMNVVLIGSNSKFLNFEITGTGTISRRRRPGPSEVNERAIYPGQDELRDCRIQGRVRNITVGVHLQPLSAQGPPPANCSIDIELSDIVGQAGTSEGYGVLLSPAEHCVVKVKASCIQRHAVYLSAGASHNTIDVDVTGCLQDAVTIFSLASQPACVGNSLKVVARGVRAPPSEPVGSNSTCFSIYGKAEENVVHLVAIGATAGQRGPWAAALVRGMENEEGPFPRNNHLFVSATGAFSGPYVIVATDAAATTIEGGTINARGSAGVIGFSDTRSNNKSFPIAGTVRGVAIDARDSRVPGIVVATERSPVDIDSDVHFTRVLSPTRDYTGRLQRGR